MNSFSIGGHRYTDPDVLSLIFRDGSPICPRTEVLNRSRDLVLLMESFGSVPKDPGERLKVLASLCGIARVQPLTFEQSNIEQHDAFIFRAPTGQTTVFYNPFRPPARVIFSIAHEIAHTFFPNTINGSQFRYACAPESREANELERLCDLAASELVMPEQAFQAEVAKVGYQLSSVPGLMARFGCSYEATTFRLATAHPHKAAAGLLRYRLRLEEERALRSGIQGSFFEEVTTTNAPLARYRRQSFHTSANFPLDHLVRWNKSFPDSSVVYQFMSGGPGILSNFEKLPNGRKASGLLQVIPAPYQRREAHPLYADLLFLWVSD